MSIYKYVLMSTNAVHNNLGHELFWTRKILLLLLKNNCIDNNIIVVTHMQDRFFLYTKYFINVITYDDFKNNHAKKNNDNNVLDLTLYLNTVTHYTIDKLKILGLNENELIKNKIFQNYSTDDFNNYVCNLDYDSNLSEYKNIIDSNYFIIHIRPTSKYINYLLDFIKFSSINVILFTNLEINYPFKTNNLRTYASLLNNENCLGLITEWSGGGQLAQFCAKKVIYYFDQYPETYFDNQKMIYESKNNDCFFAYWDHYNPIKSERHFINIIDFLDYNKLLSIIS